jgi:hypothetical protein
MRAIRFRPRRLSASSSGRGRDRSQSAPPPANAIAPVSTPARSEPVAFRSSAPGGTSRVVRRRNTRELHDRSRDEEPSLEAGLLPEQRRCFCPEAVVGGPVVGAEMMAASPKEQLRRLRRTCCSSWGDEQPRRPTSRRSRTPAVRRHEIEKRRCSSRGGEAPRGESAGSGEPAPLVGIAQQICARQDQRTTLPSTTLASGRRRSLRSISISAS